jgi:NPCBM/NEW2 domain/FecR protein
MHQPLDCHGKNMNSDGLPSSSSSQDHEILNALYEGRITESQLAELDRRMLQDEELRRHYIRLMHLHSSLHDHAAVLEGGPVIDRLLPLRKYVYGSAIAAAIVLSFWLVRYLVSPRFSPQTVASVIDVSSAQWGEFEPSHRIGNGINAGQHLVLDSGCVELLFSSGCRAIIEGPADFTATSAKELELRQGKISATMQGGGFVVTTPTGVVTDLGTQFGVGVAEDGGTEVDVFVGRVAVAPRLSSTGSKPLILSRGEAAQISKDAMVVDSAGAISQRFVMSLKCDAKVFDLVDLISGGDGMTDQRGTAIDAINGAFGRLRAVGERTGDYRYHRVPALTVVDGCFVPDGSRGSQTIDSAGDRFLFPATCGISINFIWTGGDIPWFKTNGISTVLNGEDYSTSNHSILCLHSNNALTIDLDKLRRLHPDVDLSRFGCLVGNSYINAYRGELGVAPLADVYVIVDGQSRFEKRKFTPSAGGFDVDLPITSRDRFLTLVTTDGGDGIDDDWVLWVDPHLYASYW